MFNFGDLSLLPAVSRFDASGRPKTEADRHLAEIRQAEEALRENRRARHRKAFLEVLQALGLGSAAPVSRRRSARWHDAR